MKKPTRIFLLLAGLLLLLSTAFGQHTLEVTKVSITVSDLDRSVDFYTSVLSFEKVKSYRLEGKPAQLLFGIRDERLSVDIAQLKIGNETVELMQFNTAVSGRPIPSDSRSNDLWFQHIAIVVSDMDKAYRQVVAHKVVHVSTAPQTLPDYIPAAAGISAFYFRDPDGHNLELIYFPKGKGHPKWQQPAGKLLLGIDHTAIGIEETDQGLAFYRDVLGLEVGGNSENYGPEQEHLNQVFGARLLITGLHAAEGFGVEFLDYIAPPGGRPYPLDSQPTDLWHWQTAIQVDDVSAFFQKIIQMPGTELISNGIVDFSDGNTPPKRGFLVRGPDGHALLLYQTM
jgi:catechol 2,3-dioxygenase-like lactoylglutathione lyase family enzyme